MKFCTLFFLVALCAFVHSTPLQQKAPNVYGRSLEPIDPAGNYHLEYEVDMDRKRATFLVTVRTKGYVGFGLSPTGGMAGADIVIGGVYDDGRAYFADRHGVGNSEPVLDVSQDYELTQVFENATHTTLQFYRAFDTCDDQDVVITSDTVKIIWSYGETDVIQYHGGTARGVYSANLLDPTMPPFDENELDKWTLIANTTMPTKETTYWCTMHKTPTNFNGKRHLIAFDTVLPSPDALRHTHHLTLYRCRAPQGMDPDLLFGPLVGGEGGECHVPPGEEQIIPLDLCRETIYVWAVGGKMMIFPEDVGYPISEDGAAEYMALEIHYDNPEIREEVRFESLIEVYTTPELRVHDAATALTGHSISFSHIVPGRTQSYTTVGHCSSRCTQDAIPPEGINVFNVLLHAHVLGRQLRLRHFRGRVELPWISADDHYDFDFQQNRPLREHIKIMPGDHLTTECVQSSTQRETVTMGGVATTEEMCSSIFMYYPAGSFRSCDSSYDEGRIMGEFGIEEMEWDNLLQPPIVTAPESMANKTYLEVLNTMVNWTPDYIARLEQETRYNNHYQASCGVDDDDHRHANVKSGKNPRGNRHGREYAVGYPELDYVYQPENPCV